MKRREFSKEEQNLIYDLYFIQKKGLQSIAILIGVSVSSLRTLFNTMGWKIRSVYEANSKNFSEEELDQIVDLYINKHLGTYTISKRFNTSEKAIQTALKHRGIILRNYVEAKQISRKYTIDDDFFKFQTHDMAYILGLIAADGSIALKENAISIQLRDYDSEILEKIKKVLKSSRPIDYYTDSKGISYAKLQFWSKTIKDDLAKYNIVPKKTFILMLPTFLAEEYWISYIRGYFDGDGCITQHDGTIAFSIEGASKPIIEWIRSVFANKYAITNNKIYIKKTLTDKLIYNNVYYGEKAKKIYDLLYVPNSLKLERKYIKFTELVCPRESTS